MLKLSNVSHKSESLMVLLHYSCTLLVAQLVEALRYKPEGRGFDSQWCHWIFFH